MACGEGVVMELNRHSKAKVAISGSLLQEFSYEYAKVVA